MNKIVKATIYPEQKLTKAQIKRLDELKNRPIVFDDDAPEYTLVELKQMHALAEQKRAEQNKEVVAIRISPNTLKQAKALGKGYTSFLSRLLDNAIKDKKLVAKSL